MIEQAFAELFAADWIDSWNSHGLSRILSHYSEDFEMTSPVMVQIVGGLSGTLKGKEAVGAYWAKGLQVRPDLHFELISTLTGVNRSPFTTQGTEGFLPNVSISALAKKSSWHMPTMQHNYHYPTKAYPRAAPRPGSENETG